MANLWNHLISGKTSRQNMMHLKVPIDVGYSGFAGPEGMRISIRANDRENPKERDYHVELDRLSLGKVIETLLNRTGNMPISAFGSDTVPTTTGNIYEDLLLEHGIKLSWYRYPAPSYANGSKRWYWCQGVNRYHAEHELSRLIKSFDPTLLEEYNEANE